MRETFERMRRDARGAVFVEKLIVFVPVLLAFFLGWELAEVGAANIIVQRASAAAGRAAMVVLPDDPLYYGGEPTHTYEGARRADIELAAGMVLSAAPQFGQDFEVDVSEPPSGFGAIDVTVRAPFHCGAMGLLCGLNGTLALSARTTHAYHGADYVYTVPGDGGGDVASTQQSLTARGGTAVAGKLQAVQTSPGGKPGGGKPDLTKPGTSQPGANPSGANQGDSCGLPQCTNEDSVDDADDGDAIARTGQRVTLPYGSDPLSQAAIDYRCANDVGQGANVAVIQYQCDNGPPQTVAKESTGGRHSEPRVFEDYEPDIARKFGIPSSQVKQRCKILAFYTEREPCDFRCMKWFDRTAERRALKDRVRWHFEYNPRFDAGDDPTADPGQDSGRAACKRVKKKFPKNRFFNSCNIRRSYQSRAPTTDEVRCEKYLKEVEDAARRGPRARGNDAHRAAISGIECPPT